MVPAPLENAPRCVAVMGATATGKSAVAIDLARRFDGEVVSMDSRQVYRGLDIGTGKVLPDEQQGIPHHLLDILDPTEVTSAGAHARRTRDAVAGIDARSRLPILAGGTGLYFRAYLNGIVDVDIPDAELAAMRERFRSRDTASLHAELARRDPGRAGRLSPNDRMRITRALEIIEYTGRPASEVYTAAAGGAGGDVLKIVLTMPRAALRERIAVRTRSMFEAGWVDEVRGLLAAGVPCDAPGMNSLGYGDIAAALAAGEDPGGVVERVITLTQQYAKRQETFFRGEADAHWIDVGADGFEAPIRQLVEAFTDAQ